MESPAPTPMPRSTLGLAVLLVIVVLGFVLSLGPTGGEPTYHVIRGRIERADDLPLPSELLVISSRNGEPIEDPPTPSGSVSEVQMQPGGRAATFAAYVTEGGPVDLQVGSTDHARTLHVTGPDREISAEEWARWREQERLHPSSDRSERRAGDLEAFARGVGPDAQNVVLRLVPRVTARMALRVVDPEGWAVPGVRVELRSMRDLRGGTSDAEGRVSFDDVPLRTWEATAEVPKQRTKSLVRGKVSATPGDGEVLLPLRKGVRMRVRLPEGSRHLTHLSFARPGSRSATVFGWQPDTHRSIEVLLEPDWPRVTLRAHAPDPERPAWSVTAAETTCPVVDGSEVLLESTR